MDYSDLEILDEALVTLRMETSMMYKMRMLLSKGKREKQLEIYREYKVKRDELTINVESSKIKYAVEELGCDESKLCFCQKLGGNIWVKNNMCRYYFIDLFYDANKDAFIGDVDSLQKYIDKKNLRLEYEVLWDGLKARVENKRLDKKSRKIAITRELFEKHYPEVKMSENLKKQIECMVGN